MASSQIIRGHLQRLVSAEALHEAAHVVIAVRSGLTVTTAGKSPWGFWYVNIRCDRDPPSKMSAYKIAGTVAVEMRNRALGRSDNSGFGRSEDGLSDCAFFDRNAKYMRSFGMPVALINAYHLKMRRSVERALRKNWAAVEVLAVRLDEGMPLDDRAIGKILQAADRSTPFARHASAPEPGLWSDMRSLVERQRWPSRVPRSTTDDVTPLRCA